MARPTLGLAVGAGGVGTGEMRAQVMEMLRGSTNDEAAVALRRTSPWANRCLACGARRSLNLDYLEVTSRGVEAWARCVLCLTPMRLRR
jgi:hypothetical protein